MSKRKKTVKGESVTESKLLKKAILLPDGTMREVLISDVADVKEILKVHTTGKLEKFKSKEDLERNEPYEVIETEDNVMLNEGANRLWTLICGGGGTAYTSGNARIGVGDSNSAEDPAQTGLLGGNQLYKGMDATYPQYGSARQAVFRATYIESEANWHWYEFTVDNGAVAGENINRKVSDLGTKPPTEIWRFTVTLKF